MVGRIAKAHGIGGEVSVDVRTDDPEARFARRAHLDTEPGDRGPLVVETARWHSGRLLVRFAGVADRTGAEALRGTLLVVDSATSAPSDDPEEFWDHDLVELEVVDADGGVIGVVCDILHPGGSDLLVVATTDGKEVLVPFVTEIVPVVDRAAGRIVVAAPPGLFDL